MPRRSNRQSPRPQPDPLKALREVLEALDVTTTAPLVGFTADLDAALRSAIRAVAPGRQQAKNLKPLMDAARKAFVRTLRRRAISR